MESDILKNWKWDKWQDEVLQAEGNLTLRTGRQVGKSEVISEKAVQFAMKNAGTTTMIIAASQRQSGLLFEKVRGNLDRLEEDPYKEQPTLTRILLKNGSRIYCMPTGRTGHFIRGFTIDLLIADEAAYIPEVVWTAVTPMLAVSKKTRGFGWIIMLSTPFGKGGYFYDSFTDKAFKAWHVSSESCMRMDKLFLKREQNRMTKQEYRQEYQGEFTDEWNQFFSTTLIKKQMTFIEWSKETDYTLGKRYYMGVDFAGYGMDETAFVICEMTGTNLKIVKVITTERTPADQTINQILAIDNEYKFNKIFVDDGGLGSPITDLLKKHLGRKVLGLNNSRKRIVEQGEEQKQGILKEDLYSNALMLLETGKMELISDRSLLRSMKSITFQYGSAEKKNSRKIHIFGNYSHITEALVRACWCVKERGLSLYRV